MDRISHASFPPVASAIVALLAGWAVVRPATATAPFEAAAFYPVGEVPIGVTIGDVDGDGVPDVVTANSSSRDLSVLINNGDGTFAPEVRHDAGGGNPHHVAVGDVDGDGDPDLVAAIRSGPGSIAVFLTDDAATLAPAVQYGTEIGAFVLIMADLDDDDDPDVAVAYGSGTGADVSVFRNAGDGTFGTADVYEVFEAPIVYTADLAVADVDGDGRPDLIVVNDCPTGCDASIAVLTNAGDGTFLPRVPMDLGIVNVGSVRAGDLDADGDADLALVDCSSFPDSELVIALNDGTGAFGSLGGSPAGTTCTGFTTPEALALLDVNLDGAPDAVLTRRNDDEVQLLLNRGDLTFEPPQVLETGDQPIAVAAGDLDGDGRADIVTADMGIGGVATVSVLINGMSSADVNGDGVVGITDLLLLLASWGACPAAPTHCPGDVNGDGRVGIVDLLAVLAAWG